MQKIDYKKTLQEFYRPSANKVVEVDPPPMNFLMLDGQGDPGTSQEFQEALESLYPVAYTLKFMVKKGSLEIDYGVLPLEALWWADDMTDFVKGNRDRWKWTLLIMQPDMITNEMVEKAIAQVRKKKNPVSLAKLRFEGFREGKAAQIMHIGSFENEGPTVQRLHRFIEDSGSRLSGKHHEIYLNDPRRTAPEKLKTVIRQPYT
jgi:hypothetical protein